MNSDYLLMFLLAAILLAVAAFVFTMAKKQREIRERVPGYPAGYWRGRGMGIGIALGCGMGVALHNIAMGIGVGVALGAALGVAGEKKYKDEIRPLTEEERALRKQKMMFGLAALIIGLLAFVFLYFKRN